MKPIDPAGFEARFQDDPDPWNYRTSPFEAYKRRVLLHACGDRVRARGLELACANGETTAYLARRCLRLLALDASKTALREAARRTGAMANVTLGLSVLPRDMPAGRFDLIVVSEIAYYMPMRALGHLASKLERALAPGGRIVVLHHLRPFDDASIPPAASQAFLRSRVGGRMRRVALKRDVRFEAVAFEMPRRPSVQSQRLRRR